MRATAISMCVLMMTAIVWVTLWPGDKNELVVKEASAQSEGEATGGAGSTGSAGGLLGAGLGGQDAGGGGAGFGLNGGIAPGGGGGVLVEAPLTIAERNAKTEEALAKRVDFAFDAVPLTDFLTYLGDTFGIASYVDRKALDEAGLGGDVPINNLSLNEVRGDMLLDLVLGELELCYMVRDGIVIVTTPERMEESLEVRIYNCRDLLGMAGGGYGGMMGMGMGGMESMGGAGGMMMGSGMTGGSMPPGGGGMPPGMGAGDNAASSGMGSMSGGMPMGGMAHGSGMGMPGMMGGGQGAPPRKPLYENTKAAHLINILQSTVDQNTWEAVGGPGSIGEYNGLLIVNQTAPAHEKLEKVLNMLREADQKQPGAAVRGSR